MAATRFTCFNELPLELQLLVWKFAGTATERVEGDNEDAVYDLINTGAFRIAGHRLSYGATFSSTPHNLHVFEEVLQKRKTMVSTCSFAGQTALEMWEKDVARTLPGATLYNCISPASGALPYLLKTEIRLVRMWREVATIRKTTLGTRMVLERREQQRLEYESELEQLVTAFLQFLEESRKLTLPSRPKAMLFAYSAIWFESRPLLARKAAK